MAQLPLANLARSSNGFSDHHHRSGKVRPNGFLFLFGLFLITALLTAASTWHALSFNNLMWALALFR